MRYNNIELKSIEFLLNSNATEDLEKILNSLSKILPKNFDQNKIEIKNLMGAYGNSIRTLKITIRDKDNIELILKNLENLIDNESKIKIYDNFEDRLDEKGTFYIRFNKFSLFENKLIISNQSDIILLKINFQKLFGKNSSHLILRSYLESKGLIKSNN